MIPCLSKWCLRGRSKKFSVKRVGPGLKEHLTVQARIYRSLLPPPGAKHRRSAGGPTETWIWTQSYEFFMKSNKLWSWIRVQCRMNWSKCTPGHKTHPDPDYIRIRFDLYIVSKTNLKPMRIRNTVFLWWIINRCSQRTLPMWRHCCSKDRGVVTTP
jgi:hypothetical protein